MEDEIVITPITLNTYNLYAKGQVLNFADGTQELSRNFEPYREHITDRRYTVQRGDNLRMIAYASYKDFREFADHYWWVIAHANNIFNPLDFSEIEGKTLIVPNIDRFELIDNG